MRDINKRFQGVQALSAASLEVEPGEIMALIGQNGAGKSTMIKVLTGAYRRELGLDPVRWPVDRFCLAPGGSARWRQHHLSGNQPRPVPLGGRKHLSRRRVSPLRLARLGPCECGGGGAFAALRSRDRRAPTADGILNRDSADGRDRARGLVQGATRHHGRADLLARRKRGRGSVRCDAQIARGRRGGHLHQPSNSTSSIKSATGSR